jgi:hypothetical protein
MVARTIETATLRARSSSTNLHTVSLTYNSHFCDERRRTYIEQRSVDSLDRWTVQQRLSRMGREWWDGRRMGRLALGACSDAQGQAEGLDYGFVGGGCSQRYQEVPRKLFRLLYLWDMSDADGKLTDDGNLVFAEQYCQPRDVQGP